MTKRDISFFQTDEHVVRLIALQVLMLLLLIDVFNARLLAFLLVLDFALRAFTYQPAPLAFTAKLITGLLKLKIKPIYAAPKKFAAAIGFVFSFLIAILLLFNLTDTAVLVSSVLALFAFLEAMFNICAGCYVYNWFVSPSKNKGNLNR